MPFGPNLSSSPNPYKSWARAGVSLARFPHVLANFWEPDAYPKLTAEAFNSRLNALKSNLYTLVSMPFGPNLSSPSNPYKSGAGAGSALAHFPKVLANLWAFYAYCRVPGTLN